MATCVRALAVAAAAGQALAHDAAGAGRDAAFAAGSIEACVLGSVLASGLAYLVGVRRLWRQAGGARGIRRHEVAAFAAGWLVLALALASPLDTLAARSFAAHMVQHELLMLMAAPLLVVARPLAAWAWSLPRRWRRPVGRFFAAGAWSRGWLLIVRPTVAWSLHAAALWAWHVPALFAAALQHEGWHALQHASFFGTALLFWWSVFEAFRRGAAGAALASLFTTMLHTGALGAMLVLSPVPWYAADAAAGLRAWPADALADQQLGGLIMWVPSGLVYVVVALMLSARLLRSPTARGDGATAASGTSPARAASQ